MANITFHRIIVTADSSKDMNDFLNFGKSDSDDCCDYWSKNGLTFEIIRKSPTRIYLFINTSWNIPGDYFLSLSGEHPNLVFDLSSNDLGSHCNQEVVFQNKSWVDETDLFEMVLKDWMKKQIDNLNIDVKSKEQFFDILKVFIEQNYYDITNDNDDNWNEFWEYVESIQSKERVKNVSI